MNVLDKYSARRDVYEGLMKINIGRVQRGEICDKDTLVALAKATSREGFPQLKEACKKRMLEMAH